MTAPDLLARAEEFTASAIWGPSDAAPLVRELAAEVSRLRISIAGSPDKAKRLASLVASATRLVQIERDDARAEIDRLRAALAAKDEQETTLRGLVLHSIARRRDEQIAKGWTTDHDAEHGPGHLVSLAHRYMDAAQDPDRLVDAAALLVAALELIAGGLRVVADDGSDR